MKWLWSDLNWYHLARAPILKSQSKSDKSDRGIPGIYSPRVHQMIHVTCANSNWPPLTFWDVCVIPHPQKLHDSSSDLKVHLPHSTKTWRSLATTFLNKEELAKKAPAIPCDLCTKESGCAHVHIHGRRVRWVLSLGSFQAVNYFYKKR